MADKKIILVANTGWHLYNFRLPQARPFRDEGFDVILVSPRDGPQKEPSARRRPVCRDLRGAARTYDFVESARKVKAGRDVCFQMAGGPDPGNPSSVSAQTLADWRQEGLVDLLGHVEAMDASN
jgi:hypothetical protein